MDIRGHALLREELPRKSKAFADLLRKYPPRQKRQLIGCLVLEVWLSTRKYHDKEIALLLTNAFEAFQLFLNSLRGLMPTARGVGI